MNETLLRQEIERFEGLKYKVYLDTAEPPNKTVGVGHMDNSMIVGQIVSPSIVDMFYKTDSQNALNMAKSAVGNACFDALDEVRQRLLVQLAFNLGGRLKGFKMMIAAVQSGDYNGAANQLQDSSWFNQVGSKPSQRGYVSVECMRTGAYSWE